MLCSERELGLSEDHSGILVLPEDTPLGRPLADVLPHRDLLVSEPTSNRGDWMSVAGVAREIAAVTGVAPRARAARALPAASAGPFSIQIDDPADCPRYAARIVEGLVPGPSPSWMRERLEACGVRPLMNLVDVTNYVLLELGHPLHAFDLERLGSRTIAVRRAQRGERLVTLDGKERELDAEVLAITDGKIPVALAGLMGGEPTGQRRRRRCCWRARASRRARPRRGRVGAHHGRRRAERYVDPEGVPKRRTARWSFCSKCRRARGSRTPWTRIPLRCAGGASRCGGARSRGSSARSFLRRKCARSSSGSAAVEDAKDGWIAESPSFRPDLAAEGPRRRGRPRAWLRPDSRRGAHARIGGSGGRPRSRRAAARAADPARPGTDRSGDARPRGLLEGGDARRAVGFLRGTRRRAQSALRGPRRAARIVAAVASGGARHESRALDVRPRDLRGVADVLLARRGGRGREDTRGNPGRRKGAHRPARPPRPGPRFL